MKIIDLTHTIKPGMPVYPGTEPPVFETPASIETDGFLEKKITLFSHTGTHVDAPAHLFPEGVTLNQLPVTHFAGPGFVVDVSKITGSRITVDHLRPYQKKFESQAFILLYSGWENNWGREAYFYDFPVMDEAAAEWITQFGLKGLGLDMISVDAIDSHDLPVHRILLKNNFIIIENLKNLSTLRRHDFLFCCFPLKIYQADGAPTRSAAILS